MLLLKLIEMLGNLVQAIPMEVPSIDPFLQDKVTSVMDFITGSIEILGVFIGSTGLRAIGLFLAWIALLNTAYMAYQVFWFAVKKIPFLNIRE